MPKLLAVRTKPFPEMPLPDPIDHDARRQRIVGARQPVRQFPAAAALLDRRLLIAAPEHRESLRHRSPWESGLPRRNTCCSTGSPSATPQANGGSGGAASLIVFSSALSAVHFARASSEKTFSGSFSGKRERALCRHRLPYRSGYLPA